MHKQRGATIPARLLDNLEHAADACALRLLHDNAETQTLTYRQLIDEAARWARWYEDLGLLHGDRVVIILQHSVDLYAAFVGGLLRGVVPSMFAFPSPKYSSEEYFRTIGVLVENADPRLLVTYPELAEQLTAGASLPAATRVCTPRDLPTGTSKFPVGPNVDPESTAFLQYSSGTTGIKKSVAISHRALLWQIDRYADAIRLASDDVIVSWLPLYHDMGLIACLFLPLLKRVPLVAMSPFEWVRRPGMWLRAVSDFGGTLSWLPNFAYSFMPKNVTDAELADLRLSSLRGVVNCSEPVMAASHAQLLERLAPYGLRPEALGTCYAMAENTFAVTSGGFDSPVASDRIDASEFVRSGCAIPTADSTPQGKTLVSSGQALPDTEIAIVSPQGTPLAERRVGEIVLRSPCLLNEYYRNPDATAAGLHGDRYFTGDLGYLADGELYVTGRLKDLIIIAGQNIHPQDIEALLNDVPGLIPGRNVALGVSDSTNGTEKLVILAETHATEPAERASVCGEVRRLIASGLDLVPADVRLVPPRWLRKSSSGKVSRAANRERYLALPPESAPPLAIEPTGPCAATSTLEETILHCVRTVMERKGTHAESALGLDNTLITSGLIDSLTLVSIILELENALSLHIPPHCLDLGNFDSVATIAAMIRRLRTEADEGCRETVTTAAKAMSLRERKSYDFLDAARDIDALFLGSSKAMPLHTKMSGEFGYRAFNFTVYSSRAEDWSCILRFVLAQRAPLRLVVLGMDVEAFSNAVPVDRRLLHCAPLVEHLDAEGLPEFQDERSASSPQTDEARFQTVLSQYKLGGIEEYEGAWAPQTGDYSRPNDPTFEQRQPLRLDDPLACRAEYAMRMRGFTHLDPRRLDYFASFIHKCRSRDIQVVTFMMPLHQELDRYLRQATSYAPRYAELEAYLGGLSGPGLHYHPALTTASFDGDDQDFIDGAHLGSYNADRLLRYLLQSQLG